MLYYYQHRQAKDGFVLCIHLCTLSEQNWPAKAKECPIEYSVATLLSHEHLHLTS